MAQRHLEVSLLMVFLCVCPGLFLHLNSAGLRGGLSLAEAAGVSCVGGSGQGGYGQRQK